MYKPRSLELINFGSHKHTKFDFPSQKTTLLTGINESDEGQKSNGSGKSFIIEGLSFALLGASLRKIKDKELVMDSEKDATITLILSNQVLNKELHITRKIYSNSKSGELIIEGENNITSVNEGNQFILDSLGMSREDLLNYFLLSKERYVSFFSSSDTAKKELINRFSKADTIQVAVDSCGEDISTYESEVSSYERKIESLKATLEAYSDTNNDELIEDVTNQIELLIGDIIEIDTQVENSKESILALREEKVNGKDHLDSLQKGVDEINESIREYEQLRDELDKHLRNEIECPSCHHKFSLKDEKFSLEEAKEIYPTIEQSLKELAIEKKIKQDAYNNYEQSYRVAKNQLEESEFEVRRILKDKSLKEQEIISCQSRIKTLQEQDNKPKIKEVRESIATNEAKLKESQANLSKATEWQLRFKRFKGWIANKSLKSIEGQANFYLEKLGSSLSIEISGYTPVKNGKEIREKINTTVFRNGDEASFSRFSGGERARIEVAIILAMQRIINQSTDGRGLDLLVLDEIVESIDSEGLENLLKSLNRLELNVLLITHATIETNYDNVVIVKKVGGISEIVKNN